MLNPDRSITDVPQEGQYVLSPFMPGIILDVGAGTGYCTARLAEQFPEAGLFALDIAEGMLRKLHGRPGLRGKVLRVCGDGESLPLRDSSVDLVFSNLALQWCVDLPAALAEFRRVLRPAALDWYMARSACLSSSSTTC